MKNYRDSDYALNKYREGIVYRFADRVLEVGLAAYLAENPGKTERDFRALKEISDAIYREQDRGENAQTKKNGSIHGLEEAIAADSVPLDEQYIEVQDRQCASKAITFLLDGDALTETQRRRFVLHFIKGLSLREIAAMEGVYFNAIAQSVNSAMDKIKKSGNFF